jgi:SAM-dependent methyltransferase
METLYDAAYAGAQTSADVYQRLCFRLRTKLLMRVLRPDPEDFILEVGCGSGEMLRVIHPWGEGTDVNGVGRVKKMSMTDLDYPDGIFDKIYACHSLEHVQDAAGALREIRRVLKPGGLFVALYPWEPIRGLRALRDVIRLGKGWDYARQLHVHALTPGKIRAVAGEWRITTSMMAFTPLPDFLTIMVK